MAANLRFAAAKIQNFRLTETEMLSVVTDRITVTPQYPALPITDFCCKNRNRFDGYSLLLSLPLQHPALLAVTGEGDAHGDLLDVG